MLFNVTKFFSLEIDVALTLLSLGSSLSSLTESRFIFERNKSTSGWMLES
ncbi:hypothetical protein HanIR_Chr16g0836331 [Helianthus annuus]|nr:hypothetical protein HanIR_Chr16g0836331 [Helianthus annuus]